MSTPVPATGWSGAVELAAGDIYVYTATPGAGGSLRMQWSADGTTWFEFGNNPISSPAGGRVPSPAGYVRGIALGAAGAFDVVESSRAEAVAAAWSDLAGTDLLLPSGARAYATRWSDSTGKAQDAPDGTVRASVARRLLAAYEAQRAQDEQLGPRMLARSGLPIAADLPTITASATAPASDADAATQIIYPFGQDDVAVDPIPASRLSKRWARGFSEALRARGFGNALRLSARITAYATNGNQDQDSALVSGESWGVASGCVVLDFWLDSDVLFLKTQTSTSSAFDFYVNGHLHTAAPSTNMAQDSSRGYYPTSGTIIKMKWGTVARRRITLVCYALYTPSAIYTRAVSTSTPAIDNPVKWVHIGDSFSSATGATTRPLGLAGWLNAAFGHQADLIEQTEGSTAFAGGSLIKPGDALVGGSKPSFRKQWQTHLSKLSGVEVVSMLVGHNDSGTANDATVYAETLAMLQEIRAAVPSALVFVFASNASPGNISSGGALNNENTIATACSQVPGVLMFRCQGWDAGQFLRGTGRVGATTGVGNTDLYTGTDNTHPSDAGHRAYGQMMAARIADALRNLV